jgi:hypothetical protein
MRKGIGDLSSKLGPIKVALSGVLEGYMQIKVGIYSRTKRHEIMKHKMNVQDNAGGRNNVKVFRLGGQRNEGYCDILKAVDTYMSEDIKTVLLEGQVNYSKLLIIKQVWGMGCSHNMNLLVA